MNHMAHRGSIVIVAATIGIGCSCPGGPELATELVAEGLNEPLWLTHAPGDGARLYVVERVGAIRVILNGELQTRPFLDITPLVDSQGQRGLLGIAFDPNYADNGYVYVRYNNLAGAHTLVRYTALGPDALDPDSAMPMLTIAAQFEHNNGGWIEFGPDGYLYVSIGDNGQTGVSQDLDNLLGKVLRIDVNGDDFPADPTRNYAIPADNPLVGVAGADEIWAWGFRNHYQGGFDRVTGDLIVGDVGAGTYEEVDVVTVGDNYGWPCFEATHCTILGFCDCRDPALVMPVFEFAHDIGCAVTGGRVYRGCAIPDLTGTYFCGDWCSGIVWSMTIAGGAASDIEQRQTELDPGGKALLLVVSFGEDLLGEIYVCQQSGEVRKIVPAAGIIDRNRDGIADSCEEPADLNADGDVDGFDLAILLGAWGPCADPRNCPADLDGNGVVNGFDLAILLGAWS